ncbi:hypothetical protein BJY16_005191 [Actinoplanes octamycinicus]|uniref:Uncharacterized protein n=1 Tax=Actinoplanes octamycinicus TaxID=135948 RepID=A0A7W7H0P3_9ACTN|nr:hypothetical protein [Actinoplanes octamycinicus]MBB4741732.1 hypothetical protein [Actinoplanes octamycinicus]
MGTPAITYRNLALLADAGRWDDLLSLAADPGVPVDERREVAHVVALEAPASLAVAAAQLFPDDDYGFLGPLWQVVAQHRPWRELAPHLTQRRVRDLVAQTRVLHGEDLRDADDVRSAVPLRLAAWEAARWDPEWDIPECGRSTSSSGLLWYFPGPLSDPTIPSDTPAEPIAHPAVAVLDRLAAVPPGADRRAARAAAFRGSAWAAAAATVPGVEAAQVRFTDAYKYLVSLASGDVAYGRATGRALGRSRLWEALRAMAGDPEVDAFVGRLRCVAWAPARYTLYSMQIAMEDPEQGISWVLVGADDD